MPRRRAGGGQDQPHSEEGQRRAEDDADDLLPAEAAHSDVERARQPRDKREGDPENDQEQPSYLTLHSVTFSTSGIAPALRTRGRWCRVR
jgi:hypothetical protein